MSAAKQPDPAAKIHVGEYGRYQIKSGRLSGNYVARAFPKPPTKARGMIAEAGGKTEEAAIAALHAIIDSRKSAQADERRFDANLQRSIPSTNEYVEAIRQVTLSTPQLAMLKALMLAGEGGLSDAELAGAAGFKSTASANRAFARAAFLVANYLDIDSELNGEQTAPKLSSSLAYRVESKREKEPSNWVLHEELSSAIRACL